MGLRVVYARAGACACAWRVCMWMSVAIRGRDVLAFQFSCDNWPEPRLKGVQSATAERESAPPLKP